MSNLEGEFDYLYGDRPPRRHPRQKRKVKEVPIEPSQPLSPKEARKQNLAKAKNKIEEHLNHFSKKGKKDREEEIENYSQWVQASLNGKGIIFDPKQDMTIEPHPKKKKRDQMLVKHPISLVSATIDAQPFETQELRAMKALFPLLERHISTWRSLRDNSEDPSGLNIEEEVRGMLGIKK